MTHSLERKPKIHTVTGKVASSRLSRFVAHSRIFRLFMKGKFDAYVPYSILTG
jgi:hypothetical protein